jgi:hypothetical protein
MTDKEKLLAEIQTALIPLEGDWDNTDVLDCMEVERRQAMARIAALPFFAAPEERPVSKAEELARTIARRVWPDHYPAPAPKTE